jgi:hypothetical protein
MQIGLIARAETARGLGVQTRNFFDHMPVASTLLVEMPNPDSTLDVDGYTGDVLRVPVDTRHHTLPEDPVRDWLRTVDVVFTVETTYDWRLPDWARDAGARTVIQGNPEFFRHHLPGFQHQAHPDEWWWPTSWRPIAQLPDGPVMPVPMPDRPRVARPASDIDHLHLLHVIGKRAHLDRNGSDTVVQAMRSMVRPTILKLHGLEGELWPDLPRTKRVTYELNMTETSDRWSMYAGQSVLVMPRKYGGLCLPALEAAACGVAVMMPRIAPNVELAQLLLRCRGTRPTNLSCGRVDIASVNPMDLSSMLNALSPDTINQAQDDAYANVPRWADWRPIYLSRLERIAR